MANDGAEAEDLAQLDGSLVVNMGSVTKISMENFSRAIKAYNSHGGPVLLDPVGAGATSVRRAAVSELLNEGYFDVIKGNENEIKTVWGMSDVRQRGVDSGHSNLSQLDKASLVKKLAIREKNVVVMTGEVDFISDGARTVQVKNGHHLLGEITGSGCVLGTTIAAALAVSREDKLVAALAGILLYEIAAEQAVSQGRVRGPGTFIPEFIDALFSLAHGTTDEIVAWTNLARIEMIEV
jgi:thiamine-phosphate diphosphorylase/hydroxyethylthiazole kinase